MNVSVPPCVMTKLICPFAIPYVPETTDSFEFEVPALTLWTTYTVVSIQVPLAFTSILSAASSHASPLVVVNATKGNALPLAERRLNSPATSVLVAGSVGSGLSPPAPQPRAASAASAIRKRRIGDLGNGNETRNA